MLAGKIGYFRASSFDPRSISGLGLWLDGADASSFTLNGSNIAEWRDKSGLGRHFSQANASLQPALQSASGLGNVPTANSGGKMMNSTLGGILDATRNIPGVTAFTVIRPSFVAGTQNYFWIQSSLGGSRAILRVVDGPISAGGRRLDSDSFQQVAGASVVAGNRYVHCGVLNYSAAAAQNFVNGALVGSSSTFQTPGNSSNTQSQAVSVFAELQNGNALNNFYGSIAEVVMYPRALSAEERSRVMNYLGSKWGVTLAPVVSNADAQSWINRVYANGGEVSTATASAANTFCNSIDAAGIRDRFYRLNLFAGTGLAACLVPLYRGQSLGGTQFGNATDTNNNFVSGDYAETGSTGGLNSNSGAKTLNTGVNPVTVGISFNNTHMSAYLPVAASGMAVGRDSINSRAWHIYPSFNAGNGFYRSGGTANSGIESVAYSDKTGHILATRTSSSSAAFYRKGVSVGTNNAISNVDAFASNAPGDTLIFGTNFVFNGRLASYSLGVSMTASDAAAFNSAMQAFQAALSRNA